MDGISGIILAGGRSSRMGRDKAALPFGDGTLLSAQTKKLHALGITDILISGYADGMIPDDTPGCGPLGGLATCLTRVKHPRAQVLSVDVPLVPTEVLRELIAAHTGGVTLLKHGERTEPLIAVYDAALGETARQLLKEGKRAVFKLFDETTTRIHTVAEDERLFLKCNTPTAYAEALKQTRN